MYEYYHGLVIREGTEGIGEEKIEGLFKDAGWSREIPNWQKEKFSLVFQNSTWAFTVWDQEEMIAMVRVISDKVMIANICDLVVHSNYRGKGIGQKLIQRCLQKLPHGDWFAHTSSNNFEFYQTCGFHVSDPSQNGTCTYYGYIQAKKEGHRK